ncbi:hypothetical protein PsorP6_002155 [Peronosclerospora sorghi]|uniref:Uncharacterized protein n=1 Tax=Peronosclerospora sorghi TaxID=230839 RepID=A0ACC0WXZ9_9STRA|nr:hypothetical protein PsorP6_002155 [Peronosclerospora sorghi]
MIIPLAWTATRHVQIFPSRRKNCICFKDVAEKILRTEVFRVTFLLQRRRPRKNAQMCPKYCAWLVAIRDLRC